MTQYFIGDIQGCYKELKALLKQVSFGANDELWVAGDLVARGPDSLKTLRFLKSLGRQVKAVLGNHDLHLLATAHGLKKAKPQDHLTELLSAPDLDELLAWLVSQPLIRKLPHEEVYMSHAGVSPQWSIDDAIQQAQLAHAQLNSNEQKNWLKAMYGDGPLDWQLAKTKEEKFRFTINALTRMRLCNKQGHLNLSCKEHPKSAPNTLTPWFRACKQLNNVHWVFGHWASLMGETNMPNIHALDTGCVWGNHLTLLRWHDKQIFVEFSVKKSQTHNIL